MEIIRIRVQMNGEKTALTSLNQIDKKIDEINKKKVSVNVNTKDAANAKNAVDDLGKSAGATAKQGKILGDTLSMIKFTAIAAAIGGVTAAMKSALTEMKAVDTQLTNIQKVSGMAAAELDRIGDKAYSTASKYGVAANEYLSAVYTFQKAGLGDAADQLGELATKTMLVGDTSADVASKFLIAVNAAWDMQGSMSALSTVVDEADYINNNYATSLDKLAAAMPIVASTSANLGMSIEETMAVIGTITAKTQETGTKAATAWRALAMNITGELGTIMDETGETIEVTTQSVESISDALKIYGNDAVKAAQASGQIINPMEAVISLAEAYKDGLLTDIELQNIMMNVGGKLRTNQLTALVKDLASETSTYYDIMSKLPQAAGTADSEIGVMLSSWESKTKILSNTWTEFVQKSINSDSIKGFLDGLTKAIEFMDNLGSAATLLGGIMLTTFSGSVSRAVGDLLIKLYDIIPTMASIKASVLSVQGAFGAIGVAVTVLTLGYMKLKQAREEAIANATAEAQAAQERAAAYEDQRARMEQLAAAYDEIASDGITENEKGQLQKIQIAVNEITDSLGEQAVAVDLVNGSYETQREILQGNLTAVQKMTQEQLNAARTAAGTALIRTSQDIFGRTVKNTQYAGGIDPRVFGYRNSFQKQTDEWGLSSVTIKFGETADQIVQNYGDITSAIQKMAKTYSDTELAGNDSVGKMYRWLTGMEKELHDAVSTYRAAVEAANGDTQKIADAEQAFQDAMDEIGVAASGAADEVEQSVRRIDAAMEELRNAVNGPQRSDDFSKFSEALKVFNEEVEAGRVNSNAFWTSAEFLAGPGIVAQYADNAEGLIQYIENSNLDEVFGEITDAEGKSVEGVQNFVTALLTAADETGRVAGGAAKITGEPGDYQIAIANVKKLASEWGLTEDQIFSVIEALQDYGEVDLSDSALTEYLEWIGVQFDDLGNVDFTSVVQTLSGLNTPASDIQKIVQQLQDMNVIDMQGFKGTLEDVDSVISGTATDLETEKTNAESLNNISLTTAAAQFTKISNQAKTAVGNISSIKSWMDKINGTSATTTITTRNITENVTVSSNIGNSGAQTISQLKLWAEGQALLNPTPGGGTNKMAMYATGTNSAAGGIALVGDERSPDGSPRPELINDNGRMYVGGLYGPEIVRLGSGAQVFTASETRNIFSGRVPAYARGTQSGSNSAGAGLFSKVKDTVTAAKTNTSTGSLFNKTKTTTSQPKKTYTVYLYRNDGSGERTTKSVTEGNSLSMPTLVRAGYDHLGWNNSPGATSASYTKGQKVTITANRAFYAVWKKNGNTVGTTKDIKTNWEAAKALATTVVTPDATASYGGPTSYTTTDYSGSGGGYSGGSYGGGGGGSSGGGSGSSEDPLVELKRKADEDLKNREFAIWHGLISGTMSLPEAVKAYKDAMDAVKDYEKQFREKGEDDNSSYIQDLIKQWWTYSDEIKDVQNDLLEELKKNIESRLEDAEKVKNQQVSAIEEAAKAEKDLNRLEELRLDLLEAQNALLNAQAERTVRIYNAATGQWEWVADAKNVKSASKSVEKAQKALSEEATEQARNAQIAAIEAEYEKLTTTWDDILKGLEEPIRGIDKIANDIILTGNETYADAARKSWTLGDSIASAIMTMSGMGTVSAVNGKAVMYGASTGTKGSVIVGGASSVGENGGVNYYINGVEISGDRAETMTVAELARSLSTLAIYNNT